MPLYRIRRNVGVATKEDMDASAFRAIVCAVQFPGLKWHRSFWDREAGIVEWYASRGGNPSVKGHRQFQDQMRTATGDARQEPRVDLSGLGRPHAFDDADPRRPKHPVPTTGHPRIRVGQRGHDP